MSKATIIDVKKVLEGLNVKIETFKDGNIVVSVSSPKDIVAVIERLNRELEVKHASMITGIDLGDKIELIYHLWSDKLNKYILVRVKVEESKPNIPSLTRIIPGITLYEREVHDLLGVNFEGHPKLERLVLPDDWPENLYPLRKNVTLEEIRKKYFKPVSEEVD